jgi:alpha-beta hydrolase superfamily lysophospholipase
VRTAAAASVRVAVLFLVGLPYEMAVAMVYRPRVHGQDPMQQLGRHFEDVTFSDDHGRRLSGWWIDVGGKDTVLLCHGLGASKSNALPMAEHLLRGGYNVFAFDFRAHGDSAGQVTTFGDEERRDVLAAVAWVKRERSDKARHVFGVGASMGAAALVTAACDGSPQGRAIEAVAVYGTYDDLGALTRTVCDRQFPPPLNWLGRYISVPLASLHAGSNLHGFAPADRLDRLPPRPILVIHGRSDEIIAFEHGRRLYERAREPKQSLWLDGDHNSVLNDADAARAVREFFSSVK